MSKIASSAKTLLSSLQSTQLSNIFTLCGISGVPTTKAQKVDYLLRELPHSKYFPLLSASSSIRRPGKGGNENEQTWTQPARLLSIDMGLKNLAFCVLDVDLPMLDSPQLRDYIAKSRLRGVTNAKTGGLLLPNALEHVKVVAWKRINVLAEAAKLNKDIGAAAQRVENAEEVQDAEEGDEADDTASSVLTNKMFEPLELAQIAYNLVHGEFVKYNPTHVVIERQRHRTGGHSSVQEWTIRVNTFEACLCSVLTSLQRQLSQHQSSHHQSSSNEPQHQQFQLREQGSSSLHLTTAQPRSVSKFWLEDETTASASSRAINPTFQPSPNPRRMRSVSNTSNEPSPHQLKGTLRHTTQTKINDVDDTSSSVKRINKVDTSISDLSRTKRKSATEKLARIKLVFEWLVSRTLGLRIGPGAIDIADRFVYTVHKRHLPLSKTLKSSDSSESIVSSRSSEPSESQESEMSRAKEEEEAGKVNEGKEKEITKLKKLDDLSDALLQAVATVQWDLNRRVLVSSLNDLYTPGIESSEGISVEDLGRKDGDLPGENGDGESMASKTVRTSNSANGARSPRTTKHAKTANTTRITKSAKTAKTKDKPEEHGGNFERVKEGLLSLLNL